MASDRQRGEISRTQVRRHPERGTEDREVVNAILDEGFLCHIGYEGKNGPVVLPTLYGRHGDFIYFHGSPAAGMFRNAKPGVDICFTVTLIDAFVLARSLFHHSMNYRSVVVFGRAEHVTEPDEVMLGLEAVTENALPGRWAEARQPNESELRQTTLFRLPVTEASAKVRSGPPGDDEEDLALDAWAGLIPFITGIGEPVPAPNLANGTKETVAVKNLRQKRSRPAN